MRPAACAGLVLLGLIAPSAARAENCNAPPGTSGIDQYCEALPSPGGSSGGSHHGGGGNGGGKTSHRIAPDTAKTLEHSGAAGQALLHLADSGTAPSTSTPTHSTPAPATTPAKKAHSHHHKSVAQQGGSAQSPTTTSQRVAPGPPSSAPASNPAAAVGDSIGGSVGGGFIALLVGITLVFALLSWRARRRPQPGTPD